MTDNKEKEAIREKLAEIVGPEKYHLIRTIEDNIEKEIEWIDEVNLKKPNYQPLGSENGLAFSQELVIAHAKNFSYMEDVCKEAAYKIGEELLKENLDDYGTTKAFLSPRKEDYGILQIHFMVTKND